MGCQPPSYQIVGRNLTTLGHTHESCWAWIRGCPALSSPKQIDRRSVRIARWRRVYVSLEHDGMLSWHVLSLQSRTHSWQKNVKNTPFFLNYGQHPLTPATKQLPSTVPKAADFAEEIVKSVKEARKCMEAVQQKMKARADKHRSLEKWCIVQET